MLDTNILISACWSPGGLEARLVRLALDAKVTLCVTDILLAEYRDVARRPKFAAQRDCFAALLSGIEVAAIKVEPSETVAAASDEDDNRVLECAAGASAQWLVTGNLRHFPHVWCGTRIVNARQFFDATGFPGSATAASTPADS